MDIVVDCGNYYTDERFKKLCDAIDTGALVKAYINCIGFTTAHQEGYNYMKAVKDKYGSKVKIIEHENAFYSDWSYQLKK